MQRYAIRAKGEAKGWSDLLCEVTMPSQKIPGTFARPSEWT